MQINGSDFIAILESVVQTHQRYASTSEIFIEDSDGAVSDYQEESTAAAYALNALKAARSNPHLKERVWEPTLPEDETRELIGDAFASLFRALATRHDLREVTADNIDAISEAAIKDQLLGESTWSSPVEILLKESDSPSPERVMLVREAQELAYGFLVAVFG